MRGRLRDGRAGAPPHLSVRVIVVGCAAAWGQGAGAASSCYLVEDGDTAIVLDMGQGAFAALSALRPPASLAAVLVSHGHADHCVDLIPLRHHLRYEAVAAPGSIALHAPEGLRERFDAFTGETGFLADLRFVPLLPGELRIGTLAVTVGPVTHVPGSFGFRVGAAMDRPGLVYSGDCGDPADVAALIRAGDSVICEASFGAGPVPPGVPHLDAGGAAAAARLGKAARLVLTHLQAGTAPNAARASARAGFDGDVVLARPGLVLDL